MRHHGYNPTFKFVVEPEDFNKYTEKDLLQYCLGATMYMPGVKNFSDKILKKQIPGLTSIVFDFEDACPESRVVEAEANVLKMLDLVSSAIDEGELSYEDLPLIFCRVRSHDQFIRFGEQLTLHQAKVMAGFNFPKFNSQNGEVYMFYLRKLNQKLGEILYGMPIIEDSRVAYKETRMSELVAIRHILDNYRDLVLQVRVGATDFSSNFGVRRGVDHSIYDILTVREILSDILNVFSRNNDYVLSGPVWEYFRASKDMMFEELPAPDAEEDFLLKHELIVNPEIDGLLREVILDKANGFVGRTVIHPSHVKYVNALQAVTREAYTDAVSILENTEGGVFKGESGNKMNEVRPHSNWARKLYMRSRAFGVIENESEYNELYTSEGN